MGAEDGGRAGRTGVSGRNRKKEARSQGGSKGFFLSRKNALPPLNPHPLNPCLPLKTPLHRYRAASDGARPALRLDRDPPASPAAALTPTPKGLPSP